MTMMVQNLITKEEEASLREVFNRLDTNKDGKLQYDEVLAGFEEFHACGFDKEEVDKIFALVDTDKSGTIEFTEFLTASACRKNLLSDDKLKMAYKMWDRDGCGKLCLGEIKSILGVGQQISEDFWQQIIQEVDSNGDGHVSFDEFKQMMTMLLAEDKGCTHKH